MIYVINELVSGKKFTNASSLLSSRLLSPGSTLYVPKKVSEKEMPAQEYFVEQLMIVRFKI